MLGDPSGESRARIEWLLSIHGLKDVEVKKQGRSDELDRASPPPWGYTANAKRLASIHGVTFSSERSTHQSPFSIYVAPLFLPPTCGNDGKSMYCERWGPESGNGGARKDCVCWYGMYEDKLKFRKAFFLR